MRFATSALCLVLLTFALPASAQTKPTATPVATKDSPLTRLNAKTDAILKGLNETQAKEFATIRTAHGTLRAVEDIRATLERAVKSCTAANPDMKGDLTARFQSWKNNVLPILRQGYNRIDKMILTQRFSAPSEVRAYLKLLDAVIADQAGAFKEIPVSEKDACQSMADNMADTQKKMVGLMTETLGLDQDPPRRR